jgi:hypothetical protein
MNNTELQKKIAQISESITTLRKKNIFAARMTIVVYLLLVLFVFFYTAFLMKWIERSVTPNNLSAYSRNMLENKMLTEENSQKILEMCHSHIPGVADMLVRITNERVIPGARVKIKQVMNQQLDKIIKHLEEKILPNLHLVIDENVKSLKKHSDLLDKNVGAEVSKVLVASIDKELDSIINHKVERRIQLLADELAKIAAKPVGQLTAKEAAERRIIIFWIFLLENDEISSASVFHDLIQQGNAAYQSFFRDLKVTDKQ